MERSGLVEKVGNENFFHSIRAGADAYLASNAFVEGVDGVKGEEE
jgi:hypothetical protein